MSDWDVARSSGQCARCESEFAEGQEYCAVLLEAPDGFERRDFCQACWQAEPTEHFCFWKSRVPVREDKAKKNLLVDDAVLINLFERLEQQTEPIRVRFRFVLGLILMRKKLLKYSGTVRDGDVEYWQMRLAGTGTEHQVENPKMDDQQITEVSNQLGVILRGEVSEVPSDPMALLEAEGAITDSALGAETTEPAADQAETDAVGQEQPAE